MKTYLNPLNVKQLNGNVFRMLDDDWLLLTCGDKNSFNTMTASWGGFGILWNKPVFFAFIRPSRYTFEFADKYNFFTLSFFSEEFRSILEYCGANSGRDIDKIKNTGLIPAYTEKGSVYFAQARLMIECRKLYSDTIKPGQFTDKELIQHIYPQGDFHSCFIGEILNCLADESFISKKGINFAPPENENLPDF